MTSGVYKRTPEHNAANSKAKRGIPLSPEHCAAITKGLQESDAVKTFNDKRRGVPHSPEHNAAVSKALRKSDAAKAHAETMRGVPHPPEHNAAIVRGQKEAGTHDAQRGGNDICKHHYIYDHANPDQHTVDITRSQHTAHHHWMKRNGLEVPHINMEA